MSINEQNIKNIFIYMIPKFLSYGISLITLPILTRILTPRDFGIVTLSWIFPTIAVGVFTLGLPAAAQRYYFEYKADEKKFKSLISSSQLFLYVSLVVSTFVIFSFKNHISKVIVGDSKYGMAIFITFITAHVGQIINFYLLLYQNMEKATLHSTFTLMQAVFTAVISLLFVWYFRMAYMGMIYGSFIGAAFVCSLMFFYFNKNIKFRFDTKILLENIKYGLQILPKTFTGFINKFFDKYMLNNMLSLSVVGIYNIGQSVGNATFTLMSTVFSSFQPVYYKEAFDKGKDGAVSVGRIFTIFAYITLAPVLLVILFARELIYIIAPPSYYNSINVVIIITIGISSQVFGKYCGLPYAYSKKVYLIFPITIVGTIVNIVANLVLIPKFGLIGAAVSSVITLFVLNGMIIFVGQKLYKIKYQWFLISMMYLNIFTAGFLMLYLKISTYSYFYLYTVKIVLITCYIFVGIISGILTKNKLKYYFSFFKRI